MPRTIKELEKNVGTLSKPSKMPGFGWGIPAIHCKRGSSLRSIPGTVCSVCYAMKGRYPLVQPALQRRLDLYNLTPGDTWIELMSELIWLKTKIEIPYFRIFDSGDLQSEDMLHRWVKVARRTPQVYYWMSTREGAMVRHVMNITEIPDNLIIRVSADMLDQRNEKSPTGLSSIVLSKRAYGVIADQHCPALWQGNKCLNCRACWDRDVETVAYWEH